MSNMPTFIHKKMRFGCDRSLMPVSIRTAKSIKSPCSGCSRKRSLKSCTKGKDTSTLRKDQGNIISIKIVKGLKIDLRTSKKMERLKIGKRAISTIANL